MKVPKDQRIGQNIFNFLQWLLIKGYAPANQNDRMADPFHLSDALWNKFYQEYLDETTSSNTEQSINQ